VNAQMIVSHNSVAGRDIATHIHPQTNMRAHEEIGPLVIDRGEGVHVFDVSGRKLIEGVAGLWCATLGFYSKRLADVGHQQLLKLPYQQVFAHRSNEAVVDLAEALLQRAPKQMSKAMFQSSGSEAVDTAMKIVWYFHAANGQPERRKFISRKRSYHGTTIAAASLTGLANMHNGFGLSDNGIIHLTCPHFYREGRDGESEDAFSTRLAEELEESILNEGPETIGAFFAEPIMGTGGVVPPPAGYMGKIQAVLKKYDILIVADEVICGFGRTGNYWGSDTVGLVPDMMTVAKGLSAAFFPISAVMMTDKIYQAIADFSAQFGGFGHGYTYGGHPVGAAIANETLKIYDEIDVVGLVNKAAPTLQDGFRALADHPLVGEVRGVGLMAAMDFVADKSLKSAFDPSQKVGASVAQSLQSRGVLLRALGDTLVCAPPLIISKAEINDILTALGESLDEVHASIA
jgi:4-aminobutyrate--pyruvate transaminase